MFHGIEELTKDWEGFVYWKGIQVEHYSYSGDNQAQEAESAADLAARCRHIEALGLEVTGSKVIWHWSWFEKLAKDEPFLPLLDMLPGMYENQEGVMLFRSCRADSLGSGVVRWDGAQRTILTRTVPVDPLGLEDEFGYHGMRRMGFNLLKAGQGDDLGTCYCKGADLINVLRARNVPPTLLQG